MKVERVIERRLRSHRLVAPAASVLDAATHMLAVQSQDFLGGRWALGIRTRGAATFRDVDAALDRGDIVRAWTQRGTLHILPSRDLAWMLGVTGERQLRGAAPQHRRLGIDAAALVRAERIVRAALRGGNRLRRAELGDALASGGVDPAGQRGLHVLQALAFRGVVVLGPVVARVGAMTREQHVVLTEEWIDGVPAPPAPLGELAVRFVASHGPAGARDLAWWAGLPLGLAREGIAAAAGQITPVGNGPDAAYLAVEPAPRRAPAAPGVLALPPFDEYYLSYADRSAACAPEHLATVGPSANGIVQPIVLDRGRIAGVWRHSVARGRDTQHPEAHIFGPVAPDAVTAALARYAAFVTG
ncbi:winged helix DNA-binding domain-containing protein [Microbacterium sp. RD1]|uniref:winged helix DNA-binding domain-containing protein n=1 Tax=Microbacterium sp. RD1 TaxID=3457313 RepID=UPI003FA52EB0